MYSTGKKSVNQNDLISYAYFFSWVFIGVVILMIIVGVSYMITIPLLIFPLGYIIFFNRKYMYFDEVVKKISTVMALNYCQKISIQIEDEYVISESAEDFRKFRIKYLKQVDEVADYFFLRVTDGSTYILPKREFDEFRIPSVQKLDWKN